MVRELSLSELYNREGHLVITAHRGFSGCWPENTMLAFQKAVEQQVDVLALDLRATSEGSAIVLHDSTLDRTTNATGSPNDYHVEELQQINCSHWRGTHADGYRSSTPAFARAPLPTLEEVLEKLGHAVCFNFRIHEFQPSFLNHVCELCDAYDLYEQAVLTVQRVQQAERIQRLNPYLQLSVLDVDDGLDGWRRMGCRHVQLLPERATVTTCAMLREYRLHVDVGVVNDAAVMDELIAAGIRGITTDYPDRAATAAEKAGLS